MGRKGMLVMAGLPARAENQSTDPRLQQLTFHLPIFAMKISGSPENRFL
jgi:hypothetical protein